MSDKNRWWEYYAVRYFVGTVAGAGIVATLNQLPGSPYEWALSSLPEFANATFKDIALFGAVGFAFCYVASAPMLTLHAFREHLRLSHISKRPLTSLMCLLGAIAISGAASFCLLPVKSALVLTGIVAVQVFLFFCAVMTRFGKIETMYDKLSKARAKGKGKHANLAVAELVESYRHLREHGNATSILVLELALAYVLVTVPHLNAAPLVLLLWLLPAVLAWLVGTVIELGLAHKE